MSHLKDLVRETADSSEVLPRAVLDDVRKGFHDIHSFRARFAYMSSIMSIAGEIICKNKSALGAKLSNILLGEIVSLVQGTVPLESSTKKRQVLDNDS